MKETILLISLLTLISCDKENRCFDHPGSPETITYSFNPSTSVFQVHDDLKVNFINDSVNILEISGGKNMINNVEVSENQNTVSINNTNKCLFVSNRDEIQITVHFTTISELILNGYGDINFESPVKSNLNISGQDCFSSISLELANDSTILNLEGSPQIVANGNSNYLYAYTVGKGNYYLEDVSTHHCHGHNRGIGDIHLRADQSYIIELRSRGDIYVYDTTGTSIWKTIEGEGTIYYE